VSSRLAIYLYLSVIGLLAMPKILDACCVTCNGFTVCADSVQLGCGGCGPGGETMAPAEPSGESVGREEEKVVTRRGERLYLELWQSRRWRAELRGRIMTSRNVSLKSAHLQLERLELRGITRAPVLSLQSCTEIEECADVVEVKEIPVDANGEFELNDFISGIYALSPCWARMPIEVESITFLLFADIKAVPIGLGEGEP